MNMNVKNVVAALCAAASVAVGAASLRDAFDNPPDSARPWVYWYFMDGTATKEGMKADLDAMKAAGIGGVLILEVEGGRVRRGPLEFLSPKWLELFGYAISEAGRLGIEVAMGTGPGWCGAGGKSVVPDDAMQHTVASETAVTGPADFSAVLPVPKPRAPFFGVRTLTPELKKEWESFYRDVAVIAFPEPDGAERLPDVDEKALYHRAPFSSWPGVKPYLTPSNRAVPLGKCVDPAKVVNLTAKMDASGRLAWRVPEGRWTIMRIGRRLTGQTTRPAPRPGLGFETSKFDRGAIERHLRDYADKIRAVAGPRSSGRGFTTLHFDSWEMSSQNGSEEFFKEFERRRGYSPIPYIPAINGRIVRSTEITERFLWDWRHTAQELVIENQLMPIREYAHRNGLAMSSEPYDMNPCCDLESGAVADVPMCEFWSKGMGCPAEYSCVEAVSTAHTMGRPVVGAEAFTASAEYWKQYPGSMKAQGDWALAMGINCFTFHTYQHQPSLTDKPGMTMHGYWGVNWHRNQTWWPMVDSYHRYLARCQAVLRQGRPVSDILYLEPEDAPMVFQPPRDAFMQGDFPDKKGYQFDGCAPGVFMRRAKFAGGKIDFAGGATYSALVLPKTGAMTPALLKKILECAEAGVKVYGFAPCKAPGLSNYPKCDDEAAALSRRIAALAVRPAESAGTTASDAALEALENDAAWIWSAGEKDVMNQPHGSVWFKTTFAVERVEDVVGAAVAITADNAYRLFVNGQPAGDGIDFHKVGRHDVMQMLKHGENVIEVLADNWDAKPNPAGLIAACAIVRKDGRADTLATGASWEYSFNCGLMGERYASVQTLGKFAMRPWHLKPSSKMFLYPSYESTAKTLADAGLRPDFETDGDLRHIHRRVDGEDVYFVGNRRDAAQRAVCRFRVGGVKSVEWWDPLTGERRALPDWTCANGVTGMTLDFGPGESVFVVLSGKVGTLPTEKSNFRAVRKIAEVSGPWQVRFDPAWGGPKGDVEFNELTDWAKRPEWDISHYSGIATYRKTVACGEAPASISLGDVANLARVRLNGKDLGSVWCRPWRVAVPHGVWREGENVLEIEVANLWHNRLIGDASLPAEKRLTRTTVNPYGKNEPLRRSGLFGPVVLEGERK